MRRNNGRGERGSSDIVSTRLPCDRCLYCKHCSVCISLLAHDLQCDLSSTCSIVLRNYCTEVDYVQRLKFHNNIVMYNIKNIKVLGWVIDTNPHSKYARSCYTNTGRIE